ncbi:MAG: 3-phosphoshikimate 1-carboxyvinyltransferase, partial [Acidimicrobiales bacterium]
RSPARAPDMVRVTGGRPLVGRVRTPGDKSVSHRALLLGALAEGTSVVRGLSDGDDVAATRAAVAALGAEVVDVGGAVRITGGKARLHAPAGPVDCGNSGTGMRLLAGLVAGIAGTTVLTGDASLSARPMDRVAEPLAAMGAAVEGRGPRHLPPLAVRGGPLRGIEWTPPVASAQVKSAVLLAGLWADGETVVHEPVPTRAHTEELLAELGAAVTVAAEGSGRVVRVRASKLEPFDCTVPGDPSQAAFWVVAACLVPGSDVTVAGVYAGPERTGYLDVLRRMGAPVALVDRRGTTADLVAGHAPLRGTVVTAGEIPSLDEVPVLAVAAAAAEGVTVFRDVGELRVKESDRLAAVARLVTAIGARAEVAGDDLVVHGAGRVVHARLDSGGDHRMAMAGAVAALAAGSGESRLDGFGCVGTSYPRFVGDLRTLGGTARLRLLAIDGPAGSGKSTVSRALAERLGIERLDTGAMYRAIAWAALDRGIDPADGPAVAAIARDAALEVGRASVTIDGADVTDAIRRPGVSLAVSAVAANPAVRDHLVARQRLWAAAQGGGVVEGRDIGTVVLPHADLKVFLTASPDVRARRRHDEPAEGVARRDLLDSTRTASPLVRAADARVLDTTGRTVDEVVEEVVSWL